MLQHGSYTLLIDSCYDREEFPTIEQAIEWTWASTPEEIAAVKFVLSKFFVLENGVYVQKRIQEELAEFNAKSEKNTRIALERETKRKQDAAKRARDVQEREPDVHESPPNARPSTNQEPLTINHKPIKRNTATFVAPPDGVSLSVWKDFLKIRAAKKAPMTDTALDGIRQEAEKAGITLADALSTCCARGWQGFKAKWLDDDARSKFAQPQEQAMGSFV